MLSLWNFQNRCRIYLGFQANVSFSVILYIFWESIYELLGRFFRNAIWYEMCKKFLYTVGMKHGWIVRGQTTVFPVTSQNHFYLSKSMSPHQYTTKQVLLEGGPHMWHVNIPHMCYTKLLSLPCQGDSDDSWHQM